MKPSDTARWTGTTAVLGLCLLAWPGVSRAQSALDELRSRAGSAGEAAALTPTVRAAAAVLSQGDASIDLHAHTYCSDGSDTPEEVVALAKKQGIRFLAITDHDTTACLKRAQARARKAGIELIPGMEVSAEDDSMHILAINIDVASPAVREMNARNWKARIDRARVTIKNLNKLVVEGRPIRITLKEVLAGKVDAQRVTDGRPPLSPGKVDSMTEDELLGLLRSPVTRPDIARVLVQKGYVKKSKEAFNLYLGDEGYAAVDLEGVPFREVIRTIHEAGGLAILAHPYTLFKYKRFPRRYGGQSYRDFDELLVDMLAAGLDGVEQYKNRFGPSEWLVHITEKFEGPSGRGVLLTPGSDYHGHSGVGETRMPGIKIPEAEADKILRAVGKQGGRE